MRGDATAPSHALFVLAALGGAALIFVVQPIVARQLMPALGGSPEVWSVCLAFFQVALCVGYAWAWALVRWVSSVRSQVVAHAGALALSALLLPIEADEATGLEPGALALFGWLAGQVLAPVAAVAATAPLLQSWLSRSELPGADEPYRLYAASNVGSLSALLAYPFLLEVLVDLDDQRWGWTVGYGVVAAGLLACGALAARAGRARDAPAVAPPAPVEAVTWLALSAVSSALLLAVTLHLTSDVGGWPLLWTLPLAAWLGTWVLAFGHGGQRVTAIARRAAPYASVGLALAATLGVRQALPARIGVSIAALSVLALALHGRLSTQAPDARHLPSFYLAIAVGGAVGGLGSSLLAPLLFDSMVELPVAVLAALTLGGPHPRRQVLWLSMVLVLFAAPGLALGDGSRVLHQERTFFGVLRVELRSDADGDVRRLVHGRTEHGSQLADAPQNATTYYSTEGPLGDVLATRPEPGRLTAVGLGVGTLACHLGDGWEVDFFEIDAAVARVAQRADWFSYLQDSKAQVRVHVTDGRLGVEGLPHRSQDLVVLDAFSSDAVPVHLLTLEALRDTYLPRLRSHGLIAVHTTSRYVELDRAVSDVAAAAGLHALVRTDADARSPSRYSQWVALARERGDLAALAARGRWVPVEGDAERAWTDQRASVLPYLRWDRTRR